MQNFEKAKTEFKDIQIQHLLKLNFNRLTEDIEFDWIFKYNIC